MSKRSKLIVSKLAAAIVIILMIVKLITMCFGLTFKWSTAIGIWLILCLLKGSFNGSQKN